jgi:hypothetical protein
MKNIVSIREGFATNSSSTHAPLFVDKALEDELIDELYQFGWDFFVAASKETRRIYGATVVVENLKHMMRGVGGYERSEKFSRELAKELTGIEVPEDAYVDHRSCVALPLAHHATSKRENLHPGFIQAYLSFLTQDGLVIAGGNDNTSGTHPLVTKYGEIHLGAPLDDTPARYVAKNDGAYWAIFDVSTGRKIRMFFPKKHGPAPEPYVKSRTPELVDLKITDFCPFNCTYCYQGSTPRGEHAGKSGDESYFGSSQGMSFFKDLAKTLGRLEVFEVAIGGGEPTLHPNFVEILEVFREHGIVPSFTTRNFDGSWTKGRNFARVLQAVGGIGFSVDDAEGVRRIDSWRKEMGVDWRTQTVAQIVVGAMSEAELQRMLEAAIDARAEVLLLGWKARGRAASEPTFPNVRWLDVVRRTRFVRIGVDTALVERYPAEVAELDPRGIFTTAKDGKFSMYIDAVSRKMGPSSYCDPLLMRPLPSVAYLEREKTASAIETAFAKW